MTEPIKRAITSVADTGPLESLNIMLRSIGYVLYRANGAINAELRRIGCDTILDVKGLVENWGYDYPDESIPIATLDMMDSAHLYIDVKAHRNTSKVVERWPNLAGKVLWYRINGGKPEHVIKPDGFDCGDEIAPPCPVLTPNMWYDEIDHSYVCWPPFQRFDEYAPKHGRMYIGNDSPICLIHNLKGWGYEALIENMRGMGVRCYGRGSPDGLITHSEVAPRLSRALAMVHLKSSDAPGYALYEALSAACPVICTRRLIWRNKMQDLLIPGETCLVFDRETHDNLSPEDVETCTEEVRRHLATLSDPKENVRIGDAGRHKLWEVMWSVTKSEDVDSFREFMGRNFP